MAAKSVQGAATQKGDGSACEVAYRVKRLVVSEGQVLELIAKYGSEEERREAGLVSEA